MSEETYRQFATFNSIIIRYIQWNLFELSSITRVDKVVNARIYDYSFTESRTNILCENDQHFQ